MLLAMLWSEAVSLRMRLRTSNLWALIRTAVALTLLQRPTIAPLRWTAGYFWFAAGLSTLLALVLGYFKIEGPRLFELAGLQSEGFYLLLTVGVSYLVARAFAAPRLIWPIATLITLASLVVGTTLHLTYDQVLPRWELTHRYYYWAVYGASLLWWLGILVRLFGALGLRASALQRVRVAIAAVGLISIVSWYVRPIYFWDRDYGAEYALRERLPPLVAEEIFGSQEQLLAQSLARLAAPDPARPDLYFVSFSPDGGQRVFEREALYARKQFENRFGAEGRTVALVNHRDQVGKLPLASVSNLERVLREIGRRMDVENDILFLFLNSHGARRAELSVQLDGLSFRPVTAEALAQMLEASGIRWRVLVISACYSGSFIPALQGEGTLLITAARADRTSFGCSETADFTYFGRAYFEQALSETTSFTEAFAKAKASIAEWEKRDDFEQSEPQMVVGGKIEARLKAWEQTRK